MKNKFQYLIKWKNYGMEHNTWYDINDFQNAKKAINVFEKFNRHMFARKNTKPVPIATPKQHVLLDFLFPKQPRQTRLTAKQRILIVS